MFHGAGGDNVAGEVQLPVGVRHDGHHLLRPLLARRSDVDAMVVLAWFAVEIGRFGDERSGALLPEVG